MLNEDSVILVDGTNASAGYFMPSLLKGLVTIASKGGYYGESRALGQALGGTVVSVNDIYATQKHGDQPGIPLISEGIAFKRNVDSRYEYGGSYPENLVDLHVSDPVDPDFVLPIWTSTSDPIFRAEENTQVLKATK